MISSTNENLIKSYLKKYNLDRYLDSKHINAYSLHYFKKGELICKADYNAEYFYFLVEGKAKVFILLRNGKSFLLRFYQPLNMMGDVEFLSYTNYTASVEALKECCCIAIPMDYLKKHYENNLSFIKFINSSIAEKLNTISQKSTLNLLYPVKNRFASYVIAHREANSIEVILPSSYSDISEMLGTTYRHLTRTIKELCEENIIRKSDRRITILDAKSLSNLADDIYIEQ